MNKKNLFLCLGLLLISCGNNVSSNVSISSDTSSIVSNSNLSEKVSSNNKVNSNSEVKKEEYKTFSYSYHPLSEPSINIEPLMSKATRFLLKTFLRNISTSVTSGSSYPRYI